MSSAYSKTTLWLWPTGLFPRRIIYLFLAKKITLSTLTAHNIHLISIQLTSTGLVSRPGLESRPQETSVPIMRIEHADSTVFWTRETSAILEYLSEVLSDGDDVRGKTMQQRARCRDVCSLLSEAMVWSGVDIFHSDAATTRFSGLSLEGQSKSAAEHARRKFHSLLGKLEKWVEEDVVVVVVDMGKGNVSLAGEGAVATLADMALMAPVEYFEEVYGRDWIEGHEVLKTWHQRMKREEWVVGREGLVEVENSGDWKGLLGGGE